MKTLTKKSSLTEILREAREAQEKSFTPSQIEILEKIAGLTAGVLRAGGKILLCGNGGSAADSQHIAAEFIGRFKRERKSLAAVALTTDSSILTALGNDYGYEQVFSRQVEGLGVRGDILFALSTSGNSKNVLEAVKAARAKGITTVGFTGGHGGALKQAVDHCFLAGASETPHIQEVHITALHALSEAVEDLVLSLP
ncbi:MAG: D-sedoheptulose 7-phosphate isomerase [Candidatus Omnitrophica bacterium]|nr:D-sedoheptulose 7-phosphate isomerase [Candidatus Omnitrophota bacterium]